MRKLGLDIFPKAIRRVLRTISGAEEFYGTTSRYAQYQGEGASDVLNEVVCSHAPFMVARFGRNELGCVIDYLNAPSWKAAKRYLRGEIPRIGWRTEIPYQMETVAGFFPSDHANLGRFSELMLSDMRELDILASWLGHEAFVRNRFPTAKTIKLRMLEPFWSTKPWSRHLRNRKVLVVHPFEATIRHQYERREKLFTNSDVLPDFKLEIIKAVQSVAGNRGHFRSWFDAFEYLKAEINNRDFDIAILGCGAYGFPLAAHVKRTGRQAVHMGGATQLLFGIKGARWEAMPDHARLFNEHWIRPLPEDIPQNYQKVEGGCYW
jgi:hypothetical protein